MKKRTLLCLLCFCFLSSCGKQTEGERTVNGEVEITGGEEGTVSEKAGEGEEAADKEAGEKGETTDERAGTAGEEGEAVNEKIGTAGKDEEAVNEKTTTVQGAEEAADEKAGASQEAVGADEEIKTEGFAMLMHSDYIFCCDLPENWEYYVYPRYSGEFFWLREHCELETSKMISFYYSETMPTESVNVVSSNPAEQEPLKGFAGEKGKYTFADGTVGMRSLFDGDYYYKEYLYHPGTEYYVNLVTSKESYTENEKQLRSFLDGISFEKGRLPKRGTEDAGKWYRLHIWQEDFQAELVVPAGTIVETVSEQEERGWVLKYISLFPDENRENRMTLMEGMSIPEWEERQWKRDRLDSGEMVNYDEFEMDGEKVTDYWLLRSGCHVRIYGEKTEELSAMLSSVQVR